ncbi:MAG: hypothetical protein ACKOAU_14495, partial [Pirellula sp.]
MISDALRIDFRQCLFRFAKSSLLVCAVSLTITRLVSVAVAQDPFDDQSSNPAPRAATSSQNSGAFVDSNETNAVVRSLRANPPTTPREIAQAVGLMTRIRRWDETARWLDKLAEQPIDGPTSIEVLRVAGPRVWAAIEANAGAFKPEQLQLIGKLRKLADDEVHSPENLARQVNRLTSPNQPDRLAGFDAIRSAGNSGIAALLNAVMRPNGLNPTNSMIEAFSLLGPNATAAWQAAMSTPHNEARDRLIQLVNRAPQPTMGSELLASLYDPTIPETTKEAVRKSLSDRGKAVPEAKQAYDYNIAILDKSLDQYRQLSALNDVDTRSIWILNPDGRGVSTRPGNGADQALSRAAQAGAQALRTAPSGDLVSARAIAAYLENFARGDSSTLANAEVF